MDEIEQKFQSIEFQGKPARLYPDGSIRNERGHMLQPLPGGADQITPADARTLAYARHEKRRAAVRAAANAAVQRADYHAAFGDLAYVAAITETQMIKATTPDDPKSTEAARWLMRESGEGEDAAGAAGAGAVPLAEVNQLIHELADMARAVAAAQVAGRPGRAGRADG